MLGKRKVRKNALELLFGYEFNGDTDFEEYYNNAYENFCCEDDEDESVKKLFIGVCENKEDIDATISENLKDWKISRLSKVTLSIMRISVYEMKYTDIPHAVSINEAVELAKEYAEEKAPSYVNGVLNSISKSLVK